MAQTALTNTIILTNLPWGQHQIQKKFRTLESCTLCPIVYMNFFVEFDEQNIYRMLFEMGLGFSPTRIWIRIEIYKKWKIRMKI
jgi:hypothetical protein